MIVYGYAISYRYTGDGTMMITTRIPSIHGALYKLDYDGKLPKNYTNESSLPEYPSLLLPHTPTYGEVVALASLNSAMNDFIIIGLTGGSYKTGATNLEEY